MSIYQIGLSCGLVRVGGCLFVYLRAFKVLLGVVNVLCLSIRFG